jgi:hypothetical protein
VRGERYGRAITGILDPEPAPHGPLDPNHAPIGQDRLGRFLTLNQHLTGLGRFLTLQDHFFRRGELHVHPALETP